MNIYQSIIAAAVPRPCVGQAQSNKDLKKLAEAMPEASRRTLSTMATARGFQDVIQFPRPL
jgi:hypothetical protein